MEFNVGEILSLYQDGLRVYRKWYLVVNEAPPVIKSLVIELRSAQSVFRFLLDEESNANSTLARLHESQRDEFDVLIDGCAAVLQSLDSKYSEIVLGRNTGNAEEQNSASISSNIPRRRIDKRGAEPWTSRATRVAGELLEMQNNLSTFSHLLLVLLAMNDVTHQSASQERVEVLLKSMMDYERKSNKKSGVASNRSSAAIGVETSLLRSISLRRSNADLRKPTSPAIPTSPVGRKPSVTSPTFLTGVATQPEVMTVRMASSSNSPHVINLIFPTQSKSKQEDRRPSATSQHGHAILATSEDEAYSSAVSDAPSDTIVISGGTSAKDMLVGSHHETVEITPGQSVPFSGDKETLDAVSSLLERVQRDFIDLNRGYRREGLPARSSDPMVVRPSLAKLLMSFNFPEDGADPNQRLAVYSLRDWLWVVKWWLLKAQFEAQVYEDQPRPNDLMGNSFQESFSGDNGLEDEFELDNFLLEEPYGKAKFAMLKVIWLFGDVLDPTRITQVLSQSDYDLICELQKTLITEMEENHVFHDITEFSELLDKLLLPRQFNDPLNSFSETDVDYFQVLQPVHPRERSISGKTSSIVKDTEKRLLEVFASVEYQFQPKKNLLDPAARYQDLLIVSCSKDDPHSALLKFVNAEGTIVKQVLDSSIQAVDSLSRCFSLKKALDTTAANSEMKFSFAFPNPQDFALYSDILARIRAGDFFSGQVTETWKVKDATYGLESFERPLGRWTNCDMTISDTNLPGNSWGSKRRRIVLKWKRRDQIAQSSINLPLNTLRFEIDVDSHMYRVRVSWSNRQYATTSNPGSAAATDPEMPSHFRHCAEFEGETVINDAYHDQRLPRKGIQNTHGISAAPTPGLPIIRCCAVVEPNSKLTYYKRTGPISNESRYTGTSWTCPFESVKAARRDNTEGYSQDYTLCLEFFGKEDALGFYEALCQTNKLPVVEEEKISEVGNQNKSSQICLFESSKYPGQPRVLERITRDDEQIVRTSFVTTSTSFSYGALKGLLCHPFGSRRVDADSRPEDIVNSLDPTLLNLAVLRSSFSLIRVIKPRYFQVDFDSKKYCRFKSLTLMESKPKSETLQPSNASSLSKMTFKRMGGKLISKATPSSLTKKPTIFQAKNGKMDIYIDLERKRLRFVVFNDVGEAQAGFLHFQVMTEPTFHAVWTDVISSDVSFEINQISSTADDKLASPDCRRGSLDISFHEREDCSQFMDMYEDQGMISRRATAHADTPSEAGSKARSVASGSISSGKRSY